MEHLLIVPQFRELRKFLPALGFSGVLLISLMLSSCTPEDLSQQDNVLKSHNVKVVLEPWEAELVRLTKKTRRFHNFKVAQAQGYTTDLTGYIPQMGHHFANEALIDGTFDLEHPETILYVPDENGVMQMVAVEYLVLMEDPDNPPPPPEGFTGNEDVWAIVGPFWTLHAWVVLENPNGVFFPTNSTLP